MVEFEYRAQRFVIDFPILSLIRGIEGSIFISCISCTLKEPNNTIVYFCSYKKTKISKQDAQDFFSFFNFWLQRQNSLLGFIINHYNKGDLQHAIANKLKHIDLPR